MTAVPVDAIAPSRKALSTKALVASGFRFSSAIIRSSSSIRLTSMYARQASSTSAPTFSESTNCSMRSFLFRSVGLESIARLIAARISLTGAVLVQVLLESRRPTPHSACESARSGSQVSRCQ